jgi:hypothetical protein
MRKSSLIWLSIVLLGIILTSFLFFYTPGEIYSDNPRDWIESKGLSQAVINVDEATQGEGFIDELGQQYRSAEIDTAFDLRGMYKGSAFKKQYADENGRIVMQIQETMNPNDGIIEGFIVERINGTQPIAYIFLDQDWKNKVGETYIHWGVDYQQQKKFSFSKMEKGVYIDIIEDDKLRFDSAENIRYGGIIVSDISPEKFELEDSDITLIELR